MLVSIFIASLSDLVRMSARRGFFVFWLLIIVVVLIYDLYMAMDSEEWLMMEVKWGLMVLFVILSNSVFGIYLKLAKADVAACVAAACLLTPILIILLFILLKVLDFIMRPVLCFFGKKDAYPFMPVVLLGLLATLAISIFVIPWLNGTWILV